MSVKCAVGLYKNTMRKYYPLLILFFFVLAGIFSQSANAYYGAYTKKCKKSNCVKVTLTNDGASTWKYLKNQNNNCVKLRLYNKSKYFKRTTPCLDWIDSPTNRYVSYRFYVPKKYLKKSRRALIIINLKGGFQKIIPTYL